MHGYDGDPEQFVQHNQETFIRILKHSDDEFIRGLVLSALIEYGSEPLLDDVERALRRARETNGGVVE
ncbi:hypothetical protein [Halorhabdus salina]|uniref:hypothetical protein n=1 Tax=Halorhabdus salina TaxID=2750670 RepID=UPI0015EE7D2E|nr:hypothetical protein [Halorhabdus salina]